MDPTKLDPTFEGIESVQEAVFRSLGAASVAWCAQIGDALMVLIEEYKDGTVFQERRILPFLITEEV